MIVTDNADDKRIQAQQRKIVGSLRDSRFKYCSTSSKIQISDCYWSAEWAAKRARGNWLCFPCDDCYYVPEFQERMLEVAACYGWRLVLCDAIYRYNTKRYAVMNMKASMSIAAKSAFLVERKLFKGFRAKPQGKPAPCAADAALIGDIYSSGIPAGTVQDVMVVHN